MLGLWNDSYKTKHPHRYGDEDSYLLAEKFLHGLNVEDWGCGEGRFGDFHVGGYVGIDGSAGPAYIKDDLRTRLEFSEGILLRHVLEHNTDWRKILENAVKSATRVLVIVLFTPLQDKTRQLGWNPTQGVPDLGFSLDDLSEILPKNTEFHLDIPSPSTQYRIEHVIVVRK
jgi:hypothetical protein